MMKIAINILVNLAVSLLTIVSALSVTASAVSVIGILVTAFIDNDYWLANWLLLLVISLTMSITTISIIDRLYNYGRESRTRREDSDLL